MDRQAVLKQTEHFIRKRLSGEGSGHDWWHVSRVWRTAVRIGRQEKADLFVVQLAALLHDISDWKFHRGDDDAGPRAAREWLEKLHVEEGAISHVCGIIKEMSFKGAGVRTRMRTREGMVVQDADRLDAIGAIGIARTFAYGGHQGREIHNPGIRPIRHRSFEHYKSSKGTTINHFHEKLLLLKDRMNTAAARRIAEGRHRFMERFLSEFHSEWGGRS